MGLQRDNYIVFFVFMSSVSLKARVRVTAWRGLTSDPFRRWLGRVKSAAANVPRPQAGARSHPAGVTSHTPTPVPPRFGKHRRPSGFLIISEDFWKAPPYCRRPRWRWHDLTHPKYDGTVSQDSEILLNGPRSHQMSPGALWDVVE